MIDLNELRPLPTLGDLAEQQSGSIDSSRTDTALGSAQGQESGSEEAVKPDREGEIQSLKTLCGHLCVEKELALALSGESLVPGGAAQLLSLWRDRLVAKPNDRNAFEVASTDGRPVAIAVKEWLKQPEYRHFLTAATRGGIARKSEAPAGEYAADANSALQPKSLNEYVIHQWRARSQAFRKDDAWPRTR
jgi:hypothetical protein